MIARISFLLTILSDFQLLEFPTSMNSMNRSANPCWRENSTNSRMSPSLTPRSMTALILIGLSPARLAAKSPSNTFSKYGHVW